MTAYAMLISTQTLVVLFELSSLTAKILVYEHFAKMSSVIINLRSILMQYITSLRQYENHLWPFCNDAQN